MIYKRGLKGIYWYRFMWQGKLIRESTKQGNDKVARQMEAAHRTSLAKGEVGIRERKPVPTLAEFIDQRFEPWAKARFEMTSPKTWFDYYRVGLRAIKVYKPLADAKLDSITSETVADFAAHRQSEGMQVSTVNSSLQVLRRVLRLAVEWGAVAVGPQVRMLPGERHRERVVSPEEEARYLSAAPEPLASAAAVLADTGMRPEECFRLRWESITWTNGRHGTLLVTHGKTAAARRVARGGLDLARADSQWPLGIFEPQEATPEGSEAKQRAPVRSLLAPPYLPDPARRVRLRCLDTGAHRGA